MVLHLLPLTLATSSPVDFQPVPVEALPQYFQRALDRAETREEQAKRALWPARKEGLRWEPEILYPDIPPSEFETLTFGSVRLAYASSGQFVYSFSAQMDEHATSTKGFLPAETLVERAKDHVRALGWSGDLRPLGPPKLGCGQPTCQRHKKFKFMPEFDGVSFVNTVLWPTEVIVAADTGRLIDYLSLPYESPAQTHPEYPVDTALSLAAQAAADAGIIRFQWHTHEIGIFSLVGLKTLPTSAKGRRAVPVYRVILADTENQDGKSGGFAVFLLDAISGDVRSRLIVPELGAVQGVGKNVKTRKADLPQKPSSALWLGKGRKKTRVTFAPATGKVPQGAPKRMLQVGQNVFLLQQAPNSPLVGYAGKVYRMTEKG